MLHALYIEQIFGGNYMTLHDLAKEEKHIHKCIVREKIKKFLKSDKFTYYLLAFAVVLALVISFRGG